MEIPFPDTVSGEKPNGLSDTQWRGQFAMWDAWSNLRWIRQNSITADNEQLRNSLAEAKQAAIRDFMKGLAGALSEPVYASVELVAEDGKKLVLDEVAVNLNVDIEQGLPAEAGGTALTTERDGKVYSATFDDITHLSLYPPKVENPDFLSELTP